MDEMRSHSMLYHDIGSPLHDSKVRKDHPNLGGVYHSGWAVYPENWIVGWLRRISRAQIGEFINPIATAKYPLLDGLSGPVN